MWERVMVTDLAAALHQLKRIAAANAAGDPCATADGTALLLRLVHESELEESDAAEQVFCFFLEVASPSTSEGESIRLLLGSCVLEVLPRLMQLATVSPRAATAGADLVELLVNGMPGLPTAGPYCQEVCSPRELLTALLEVYDLHKDADPDAPIHMLLLRLLGLIPRLVAAVQRRRLPVALSCLAAVANLAATEGQKLTVVREMVEAGAAAVGTIAAVAGGCPAAATAGNGGRSRVSREGHQAEAEAETAMEIWHEEEMRLVTPFVSFAQQLQDLVLERELSALPLTSQRTTADINDDARDAAASSRRERLRLSAWLLALFGALWPAWGPILSAGGSGGSGGDAATAVSWCGTQAAATLLNLLLGTYLLLPPSQSGQPQQKQQQEQQQLRPGTSEEDVGCDRGFEHAASIGNGRGGGGGGDSGAVDWSSLWAAAVAATDPDMEVASDPELPLIGAATILWLATAASAPTVTIATIATIASAAAASARGWNCPAAPEPREGDPLGALKVALAGFQDSWTYMCLIFCQHPDVTGCMKKPGFPSPLPLGKWTFPFFLFLPCRCCWKLVRCYCGTLRHGTAPFS
ncbi:hypothetical protein Vafri_18808 [Volvox africanus]|uniref:Uncharacterized protein n=1 Tax=Volvox africanus TaxID=51714 RepID=A0A8J4BT74_9CHLO|nr:hypothetical protein Vafri_18808 [Volvox africanus]